LWSVSSEQRLNVISAMQDSNIRTIWEWISNVGPAVWLLDLQ